MEHSYSRDRRPTDKTMATRTLLIHKPPLCPSCHASTPGENNDLDMEEEEMYPDQAAEPIDPTAKGSMEVIGNIVSKMKNTNSEDEDWEENINKTGWTVAQLALFNKAAEILSLDRLARLTHMNHPQEAILRRADIDKAVVRMRKILSMVYWDHRLTQWLHGILFDHLPASFLTAYMDILQTLRSKVPSLVDKMLQGRSNDLIEAATKAPWGIEVPAKDRKLPVDAVILLVPPVNPDDGCRSKSRERNWTNLLSTMSTNVIQVTVPEALLYEQLSISEYVESLVTVTRTKLQEIRKDHANQPIILVGFNSGAALAVQVALIEPNINSIICMGFSTHTLRGARGHMDDKLIELQTPVLFVIGQNAARTSQEQIEALREQMIAQTALVVVGSADDLLQVDHAKRKLEAVTQLMVDNMIMDEVAEFTTNCITNPPATPIIRRLPAAPAIVVVLNGNSTSTTTGGASIALSPLLLDKKVPKVNGLPSVVRKRKSPDVLVNGIKAGRVTKKKLLEMEGKRGNLLAKLSPPKKEYCERVSLSSPAASSYEIVTGKVAQEVNVRQVIDGGFIQITDESSTSKWRQVGRNNSGAVMLPVIQKQRISLGSQFTPMRTNSEHLLINAKQSPVGNSVNKDSIIYTINTTGGGQNYFSLKPTKSTATTVMETIDLVDTDEEIVQVEEERVLEDLTANDINNIPVVFQDSDGNIQEPIVTEEVESGNQILITTTPVVAAPTMIPRPNKFIYYKPQTIRQPQASQYVLLTTTTTSAGEDKKPTAQRLVTATKPVSSSSKPVIISVETPPQSMYQIVTETERKADE